MGAEPLKMTGRKPLVLVVEDDLAVRESLKFALQLEGLEVHACCGGADLMMHPLLWHAQCIVLDCQMPVMDGFEVLKRLKAADCHVPVVLITSQSTRSTLQNVVRAGVLHVIEKPLIDDALIDAIRELLDHTDQETDPRGRSASSPTN